MLETTTIFGICTVYIIVLYNCIKKYSQRNQQRNQRRNQQRNQRRNNQRNQQRNNQRNQQGNNQRNNSNAIIVMPVAVRIPVPTPEIQPQRILTPESIYNYRNLTFNAENDFGKEEWNLCSICLEQMCKDQLIQLLPCGHYYHNKCLDNWFKKKKIDLCCPLCNHIL